jgi:putative transposase
MVRFVDGHRAEFEVEPICRVLQFAPSTYYAAKTRLLSARAVRDAVLKVTVLALWQANYEVYGVRKLWKAMLRDGQAVGRDQVGRLMWELGICGARRGRSVRTTRPDPAGARAGDLVKRHFAAEGPNRLWVTDLTYVVTWAGTVYVCFIVDVFSRMIVGWRWRRSCGPRWSSTRWRWPAGPEAPSWRVWCAIPTQAARAGSIGGRNTGLLERA